MTLPTPYDVMMLHNYLTAQRQPSHLRTLRALVLAAGTPDFYADVADTLARHPCTIRDPLHPTLKCVSPVGHGGAHNYQVSPCGR